MENEAKKLYISRDVFGVKPGDVTRAYIKDDPSENPVYLAVFSQEKKFLGLIPHKKYFLANLTDFTLLGSSQRSLQDMKQLYNETIANPKAISRNYRPLYQNYSDLLAIKKQLTRLFSMELKICHNNGVEKILEKGEIIFEQSN